MAKSSIHIATGHAGYLAHNDRSQKTVNTIFPQNQNEILNKRQEAFRMYKSELEKRSSAYKMRTGQGLQKRAITHLSAVLNLNKEHTLEDVSKVCEYLEKTFDTKVFQVAIHRDEGHIADDGSKEVNYHAHIEFMGLDTQGQSVRKKLTKSALSKLQTETAKLLNMERGKNYARERSPRPKRLDTHEYKAKAKALQEQRLALKKDKNKEREEVLAKLKDVNEENKRLRAKLKEQGASREQYAELEETIRELKEGARRKDLTLKELETAQKELLGRLDISEQGESVLRAKNDILRTKLDVATSDLKDAGVFIRKVITHFDLNMGKIKEVTKSLEEALERLKGKEQGQSREGLRKELLEADKDESKELVKKMREQILEKNKAKKKERSLEL
jgi:hypothetical protein